MLQETHPLMLRVACFNAEARRSRFVALINHLRQARLARLPAGLEGTGEAVLRGNAVDAVRRVQVLDNNHLVASGRALAGGDDGPGEEEFPDLVTLVWLHHTRRRPLTLYHLGPYLALMASTLPTQLRYHLHRVPE